ncbi:MAG: hypothetical protein HOY78_48585, partial [Saccharothrix sp.]|nr:hypothetical protein [Saccharothrix sp.]
MTSRRTASGALACALLVASCAGDSGTADPPAPVGTAPPAATVRVEARDIYQTARLEGVVEAYEPVAATAPKAGHFVPARGVRDGQSVEAQAVLGAVHCPPEDAQPGTTTTTSPTGTKGA